MRFYVPVGPRGVVFRVGMVWTDVTAWLVYWRASRRRASAKGSRTNRVSHFLPGQPPSAVIGPDSRRRPSHNQGKASTELLR